MICLKLMITFAGNKTEKLFPVRFRYRHCCVSFIMRPLIWLSEQVEFETPLME